MDLVLELHTATQFALLQKKADQCWFCTWATEICFEHCDGKYKKNSLSTRLQFLETVLMASFVAINYTAFSGTRMER